MGLMVKSTTFCMKKINSYAVGYTALSFLIQVRLHISVKVNSVKIPPQFLIITFQMRQYINVLVINEASFLLINGSITL